MKTEPMPNSSIARPDVAADDTTRQLTRIWQELLGVDSIGVDQNYFDLGGDSSLAVHLFVQIERVFKVKLPLATLFDAPTISLGDKCFWLGNLFQLSLRTRASSPSR